LDPAHLLIAKLGPPGTKAHLDPSVSPDISWLHAMELHLFVPSPVGMVSKGNHSRQAEDEHSSTLHRVIVPKEEIAACESVIHFTARVGSFKNAVEFAGARTEAPIGLISSPGPGTSAPSPVSGGDARTRFPSAQRRSATSARRGLRSSRTPEG
jgi:hypothetical protein